ncbi:hypothetical protein OIU74_008272 [Salix koriyanagi]|uniref:Uncharacterized protein n=1 Tax=Salix koriyanagi TaxID=2511006 RepID=A0A9Q0U5L5_9ROSI|nr:hypothetical protein OIU74_008272 [Salix koriyanagi]
MESFLLAQFEESKIFGEDTIIGNLDTERGPNLKALVMKGWDRFHQSGKEYVKMDLILAFTATGLLLLPTFFFLSYCFVKMCSYINVKLYWLVWSYVQCQKISCH